MRRSVLALLATLPLLLGAGPPRNVLLSRFRTEPTVAIAPANPSVVVVSGNTNYIRQPDGTFPVPFFTSHDGGASFSTGTLPIPQPYTTGADTSIAIAQDGTVFYSYLAESPTYCSGGPGGILLAHSIDHGLSFRGPIVVDSNQADDRPTLAVESVPGQPSHLFIAWTRDFQDHSEIWDARSLDGGATFTTPALLYSSPLENFGAEPVVGPGQYVYVVWLSHRIVDQSAAGPAQVLLTASDDDGAHFGPVRGAGRSFVNLPELAHPGPLRDLSAPSAVAAPSGALYVTYASVGDRHPDGSVDADIWLTRSLDHGTTWSEPQRVNDVRNADRFMPALSVMTDGSLGVAFYDRRAGSGELDVYAARASFFHGFEVTQNVRVNSAASPISDIAYFKGDAEGASCFPSGRFFGDYIGAAPDGSSLGVVWADTQLQQKRETDLWFARVPLPSLRATRRGLPLRELASSGHHPLLARGWARVTGAPRSLLAVIAAHSPLSGLTGMQLLLVCLVFLLPALTATVAVVSLRASKA